MRIGIIGCGLIGRKRAAVIAQSADHLIVAADPDRSRAEALARDFSCEATYEWPDVVGRQDLDVVIVATPNKWLLPVVLEALAHGMHVLCEKPPGRNAGEAASMVETAKSASRVLKIGFNHRHHPSLWKAHELFTEGAIGEPLFARCRYGHGGRPGYDQEWRGDPELSGGGELLDQGIHVADLFRWFLGDFSEGYGRTAGYVWTGKGVEDNGFAIFRTANGQTASMHVSWNQWKNLFSFELFGRDGYLVVDGLGGSYGMERLTWGRRKPESGPPDEQCYEFPAPDESWTREWQEFTAAIREGRQPLANGHDGLQAMRMIQAVYESSRTGHSVNLRNP